MILEKIVIYQNQLSVFLNDNMLLSAHILTLKIIYDLIYLSLYVKKNELEDLQKL